MLTLVCLVFAFAVLLLTYVGGEWLDRGSRSEPADPTPPHPRDPFRTTPYQPAIGLVPGHVTVVIIGALSCLLMLDETDLGFWVGTALGVVGFYQGGSLIINLTGVRMWGRAAVATAGFILAAWALTYYIRYLRGMFPE